jgi:hypothetical protein
LPVRNVLRLVQDAHQKVITVLGFLMLSILVLPPVSAAESRGLPRVDIRATCRAAESDIKKLFGNDTMVTVDGCLNQENSALGQLLKDWTTYPAGDKAHCVQPRGYMPSYVEWLTCLEIEKDLRRIRAEEKSGSASPKRARSSRN